MYKFLIPLLWGAGGRWFESSRPDRSGVIILLKVITLFRAVAQPGSALRSGRRGRWFESSLPDMLCEAELFYASFYLHTSDR